MKRFFPLILTFLLLSCSTPSPTSVLVLPALHGAHESNPNYSYQDLMQHIRAFAPDAMGVEIRPVDMNMNSDSLDLFYPLEMIMVRDSFPGKVFGIDFYTEATENTPVHRDLFTGSSEIGRIRELLQAMQSDSLLLRKYEDGGIPKLLDEQKRMAQNYSAEEFLKGAYDSITRRQYQLEDSLYKNTPYQTYSEFNNRRDQAITANALKLIEQNRGKKLLILVGANHRARLMDSLQKRPEVEIIGNQEFREMVRSKE